LKLLLDAPSVAAMARVIIQTNFADVSSEALGTALAAVEEIK